MSSILLMAAVMSRVGCVLCCESDHAATTANEFTTTGDGSGRRGSGACVAGPPTLSETSARQWLSEHHMELNSGWAHHARDVGCTLALFPRRCSGKETTARWDLPGRWSAVHSVGAVFCPRSTSASPSSHAGPKTLLLGSHASSLSCIEVQVDSVVALCLEHSADVVALLLRPPE